MRTQVRKHIRRTSTGGALVRSHSRRIVIGKKIAKKGYGYVIGVGEPEERRIFGGRNASSVYPTAEAAFQWIDAAWKVNSKDTLRSVGFINPKVYLVKTYAHGDPIYNSPDGDEVKR